MTTPDRRAEKILREMCAAVGMNSAGFAGGALRPFATRLARAEAERDELREPLIDLLTEIARGARVATQSERAQALLRALRPHPDPAAKGKAGDTVTVPQPSADQVEYIEKLQQAARDAVCPTCNHGHWGWCWDVGCNCYRPNEPTQPPPLGEWERIERLEAALVQGMTVLAMQYVGLPQAAIDPVSERWKGPLGEIAREVAARNK